MSTLQIEYKLTLSPVLKQLIKDRGLSVTSVARKTGIPLQTIHGWLNGSQPKNLVQIKRLAVFLNVDLDYLCFGPSSISSTNVQNEMYTGTFEITFKRISK